MPEYRNTRPESEKGRVYLEFKKNGKDAARKLAAKLEIASHRVERWLRTNFAPLTTKSEAKPKPKAKAAKKIAKRPAPKKAVKKSQPATPMPEAPVAPAA